jgi:hypothetical protein
MDIAAIDTPLIRSRMPISSKRMPTQSEKGARK